MAVGKRGILGGLSGSVGNIVGTSWKGRAVFKAKPLSVANPRTTPQVNQRTKFSAIAVFGSLILSTWIKPLWDRWSGDVSGYNKFCSLNKAKSSNSGVLTYSSLIMSKGKMMPPVISGAVADAGDNEMAINVDMPSDLTWGQDNSDVFILVMNETTGGKLGTSLTQLSPGLSENINVICDDFAIGNIIRIYVAFRRADGTQVSDSVTTTTIAIA